MVFSSLPLYHLDPPPNWAQEQLDQHPGGVIHTQNSQVLRPPQPPPPPPPPVADTVGGGSGDGRHHRGSTRPGSMADQARLAKMAQPEAALKCPRCESTNTKFCYYNNYSLSQPRHFCKTCRRYWTRGGSLRNVPVGGGCRRKNKRSKGSSSSRSKSPTKAAAAATSVSISNSATVNNSTTCCPRSDHHHLIGHLPSPLLYPPTTSHSYSDYDVVFGATNSKDAQFQIGCSGSGGIIGNNNGFTTTDQWKLPSLQHHQQFPSSFLTNLEAPVGLYQFERAENFEIEPSRALLYSGGSGIGTDHHQLTSSTIKMEENIEVVGLSKSLMGNSANNGQFWDASAWNSNNISSFASSTTTHLM